MNVSELEAKVLELELRLDDETAFWRETVHNMKAKPKFSLAGYRTKIAGWLAAIPMVTLATGFQVDPQAMSEVVQDQGILFAVLQLAGGFAVHYYRGKAK